MDQKELNEWKKVGKAAADAMSYARKITKKDTPLIEIAERVEDYVKKRGFSFAFPINLSTQNIAAHYTPVHGDNLTAQGLIKIDLGISSENGFLSDTATSLDLTPENKYKELIKASEYGLNAAIKTMRFGVEIREIGAAISSAISSKGFVAVKNLSGHSIEKWKLHAGVTVPNYDNRNTSELKEGVYASEPFATTGDPLVTEGQGSNIWILVQKKPTRLGREVLDHILKEYKTLAFSSRWIMEKMGTPALLSLEKLRQQGILYHFPQLIKRGGEFTSQSEHAVAVLKDKTVVLTERED